MSFWNNTTTQSLVIKSKKEESSNWKKYSRELFLETKVVSIADTVK